MAFDPANYKLWGSIQSRSYRSYWGLRELGLMDKIATDPVPQGGNGQLYPKDEAQRNLYRSKLHPDLRVPVLSAGPNHGEGFSLFESLAINYYLAKKTNSPLGPKSVEEEARIMQWSIWVHAQCEQQCLMMLMANMGKDKAKSEERKKPLLKQLERPMAALDTWLGAHKYLLGDDRWSIADLNVASVLQWAFENGQDLGSYPNVKRWWEESSSRPSFAVPAAKM